MRNTAEFHSDLQQKINLWGCTLVQTKLNAFARQMSPPEMKPNAQYRNFMLLCCHGRGGDLKTAAGFQSVTQNIGQWHLCDDKRLCWCQNGLRHVVDCSTWRHLYFTFIQTVCPNSVCCFFNEFNSKVADKRGDICFARIVGKTPCCAQQERKMTTQMISRILKEGSVYISKGISNKWT